MSRINTNVLALTAQNGLAQSQRQLASTLQRLSTGLRINRGADDPAGLIASEGLRSELAGIRQGIDNSTRASNVIATAEGALSEVASLLLNIKALVVQAANTGAFSEDEIRANQLQIDSAVDSITRISNVTTFAGLRLLNGNLDYLTSGVSASAIRSLDIQQVNFGLNSSIPVHVNVLTSARPAQLRFTGSAISNSVTLEVAGTNGVSVLSFVSGTRTSAIAFAVNQASDSTNVRARQVTPGVASSGIVFQSTGFGSNAYVSVKAKTGNFNVTNRAGATVQRTVGENATATINGAVTVGDGLNLSLNTTGLNLSMQLAPTFGIGATSFAITGGGALFQLGPQVTTNQQVNVAIGSIAASSLGNSAVGFLTDIVTGGNASLVSDNSRRASEILETAIRQVAVLRGRLGAFERNTLQTNIHSLQVALENVTSSESQLRDADFAEETSRLTRAQILTQAGTSVLATANTAPQNVLTLLGGG